MGPLKNSRLTATQVLCVCPQCGKEFVKWRSQIRPEWAGPFCSQSCSCRYRSIGAKNPNYRGGLLTKACLVCGETFQTPPHTKDTAKYCSRACQHASLIGRPSPKKIVLAPKNCMGCGKSFIPARNNTKYCSRECKHIGQSEAVRGEKGGRYVHGQSAKAYPRGWNNGLKGEIRRRDGFECQYCLKPQRDQKRALSVHHVDYHKANLSRSNLITLCDQCHSIVHGKPGVRAIWQTILAPMVRKFAEC